MEFFYFKIQTGAKVLTNKSLGRAKCEHTNANTCYM